MNYYETLRKLTLKVMKASLFSPILILLIITLFAKASMLFGRIQEQTSYSVDTSTSSVLVDTAYAKSSPESDKSDNSVPEDTNSNKRSIRKNQQRQQRIILGQL